MTRKHERTGAVEAISAEQEIARMKSALRNFSYTCCRLATTRQDLSKELRQIRHDDIEMAERCLHRLAIMSRVRR